MLNELEGTSGSDAFVLSYSASSVSVTMSVNGGAPIRQGTFALTSPLRLLSLQARDSVRVVGTRGNDVIAMSSSSLTINGARIVLNGPARLTLAGGPGNDEFRFDADGMLGLVSLDEAAGGIDTIDFSSTTTQGVVLNLSLSAQQIVNPNLTLKLGSALQFEILIGGSRKDRLTGNSLANVLVGNAGNDTLIGNSGRDILIGGLGLDTLSGGNDDDVLISGRTSHDVSPTRLGALLSVWISGSSYATRVAALKAGVGSSKVALKAKSTVLNDSGHKDIITGGKGTDWYFKALDEVITGLVSGEIAEAL